MRERLFSVIVLRTFRSFVVLLLAILASSVLIRLAPGSDVDERELAARMSNDTVQRLRGQREEQHRLLPFLSGYLGHLLRGKGMASEIYGQAIGPLILDRCATTAHTIINGLLIAW